ncbi:MAG: hypothetical protein H8D90_00400, partial [Candidatus Omnitrophica bacterium]|nr:hypothetical protein [Candidatus Omnitrophota bacterium]
MNWKKIKLYWGLHWIKVLIISGLSAIGISLVIFITKGIQAWNNAESYLRESQLAMMPLQLYLQMIMALIFGTIYTFMMYWLYFKRGAQSFTQKKKTSVAGEKIGITWADV